MYETQPEESLAFAGRGPPPAAGPGTAFQEMLPQGSAIIVQKAPSLFSASSQHWMAGIGRTTTRLARNKVAEIQRGVKRARPCALASLRGPYGHPRRGCSRMSR